MQREDQEKMLRFFRSIPEEDRWFLRDDVADAAVIKDWADNLDYSHILPILAETEDEVVACASLHFAKYGCARHTGELRIVIGPGYRNKKLGTWMLLDLINVAMKAGLEKLVAELYAGVQEEAIRAAKKLDFFEQARVPDFARARDGETHDLVIMVKTLHHEWTDY
jgi:L-amino acid N-acyltransferase YncA